MDAAQVPDVAVGSFTALGCLVLDSLLCDQNYFHLIRPLWEGCLLLQLMKHDSRISSPMYAASTCGLWAQQWPRSDVGQVEQNGA